MADLSARLAALAGSDDKPAVLNPWLALANSRKHRWQFRNDYDKWKEFADDLRGHPGIAQAFPTMPEETRTELADAIEAALAAVDADDTAGSA
jgi:hypothetical protein